MIKYGFERVVLPDSESDDEEAIKAGSSAHATVTITTSTSSTATVTIASIGGPSGSATTVSTISSSGVASQATASVSYPARPKDQITKSKRCRTSSSIPRSSFISSPSLVRGPGYLTRKRKIPPGPAKEHQVAELLHMWWWIVFLRSLRSKFVHLHLYKQ